MPTDALSSLSHCWHRGPGEALEAKARKGASCLWSKRVKQLPGQEHSPRPHALRRLPPAPQRVSPSPSAWPQLLPVLFRPSPGTLSVQTVPTGDSGYPVPSS